MSMHVTVAQHVSNKDLQCAEEWVRRHDSLSTSLSWSFYCGVSVIVVADMLFIADLRRCRSRSCRRGRAWWL